jgi:biotin carboxylase
MIVQKNNKRLLILNGSHSEIPLIQAAKKLGFYVITTGNAAHLIGHNYSDEYHFADFSDESAILNLCKRLNIDYICSNANDFGAITAAYVAEKLNLPGHDSYQTALVIHHKDQFKKFALQYDIPTPYASNFEDKNAAICALNNYQFPVMIKPVDMTGGKGVSKVSCQKEYVNAVEYAFNTSKAKRIVIEEFVEGTQHSFSTFILNRKVVFYFSDNEYSYLNPFLVTTSAAPAIDIHEILSELVDVMERIAEALLLTNGVLHAQYIYSNRKFQIIEITRRCSGDLYPYPVSYSAGINWAEWIVRAETGMNCLDFPTTLQTGYCGRHCIMGYKNGIIKTVVFADEIKSNIYDQLMWWKSGDFISNYLLEKLGVIFFRFDSMDEMLCKINNINSYVKVEYL